MRNFSPLWGIYAARILMLVFTIILVDQAFKLWLLFGVELTPGERIRLAPFFDIVLVWNQGISYGLFQQGVGPGRWFLVGVSLVTVVVLWLWANARGSLRFGLGTGLVIGGGLGNMIDRVAYGAVADFFSFHAFGFYWYVFNIADIAITAGFFVLFYDLLWPHKGADAHN